MNNGPACATLIVVRSREARDLVLRSISPPVVPETIRIGRASVDEFFLQGAKYAITVSQAADAAARIQRVEDLQRRLSPGSIILINPGYTADDAGTHSNWFYPDGSDFFRDLMGFGQLGRDETNSLRKLFGEPESGPVIDIDESVSDDNGDISPDDMLAIQDALQGIEREQQQQRSGLSGRPMFIGNNRIFNMYGPPATDEMESISYNRAYREALRMGRTPPEPPPSVNREAYGFAPAPGRNSVYRFAPGDIRSSMITHRRPPAPAPAPRSVMTGSTFHSRMNQRMQQAQRSSMVVEAASDPDTAPMVKLREEDEDIPAMALTADDNTCMICMASHVTTMVFPCLHFLFCRHCIEVWNKNGKACPVCKTPIKSLVQPRGHKTPQDESRKRKRDAAHLESVAQALIDEGQQYLAEAAKLRGEPAKLKDEPAKLKDDPANTNASPAPDDADVVIVEPPPVNEPASE